MDISCSKMKEMSVWTTSNVVYLSRLNWVFVAKNAVVEFGSQIPIRRELDMCGQIHSLIQDTLRDDEL